MFGSGLWRLGLVSTGVYLLSSLSGTLSGALLRTAVCVPELCVQWVYRMQGTVLSIHLQCPWETQSVFGVSEAGAQGCDITAYSPLGNGASMLRTLCGVCGFVQPTLGKTPKHKGLEVQAETAGDSLLEEQLRSVQGSSRFIYSLTSICKL